MSDPAPDPSPHLVTLLEEQLARKDERIAMLEALLDQTQRHAAALASAPGPARARLTLAGTDPQIAGVADAIMAAAGHRTLNARGAETTARLSRRRAGGLQSGSRMPTLLAGTAMVAAALAAGAVAASRYGAEHKPAIAQAPLEGSRVVPSHAADWSARAAHPQSRAASIVILPDAAAPPHVDGDSTRRRSWLYASYLRRIRQTGRPLAAAVWSTDYSETALRAAQAATRKAQNRDQATGARRKISQRGPHAEGRSRQPADQRPEALPGYYDAEADRWIDELP